MQFKKILLVDDKYGEITHWFADAEWELISTQQALTARDAFRTIREHPEADAILLDGFFGNESCLSVVQQLTPQERQKIICFSSMMEHWKPILRAYGIRHFPGKGGDYNSCIAGVCSCA